MVLNTQENKAVIWMSAFITGRWKSRSENWRLLNGLMLSQNITTILSTNCHKHFVECLLLLLLLLLNQLYNPGWVLACSTIFFQASLSSILVFQFVIFIARRSASTSSFHLILGLPRDRRVSYRTEICWRKGSSDILTSRAAVNRTYGSRFDNSYTFTQNYTTEEK
jgi:hypothetical protein